MAVFIGILPCLFATKLSYAQLFKLGHAKLYIWYPRKKYDNTNNNDYFISPKPKIILFLEIQQLKFSI